MKTFAIARLIATAAFVSAGITAGAAETELRIISGQPAEIYTAVAEGFMSENPGSKSLSKLSPTTKK